MNQQHGRHSPGYDFFGTSPAPVDATAAAPSAPSSSATQPAVTNRFGTAVPVEPTQTTPFPIGPPPVPGVRPGMPTGVKILIGFACGALALFMIGVLTAVAIPVFLNQRAKATAEATTLRLPASVGAHQQLTDTTSSRTADQIRSMLPRGAEVGIYGTPGDPSLIVYVYPSFLPAGADAAFVAGVAQGAAHEGVPMHEVDTGRLGGFGRCGGVVGGGATHCVFADSAGAVGMVVRGEGATAVREAVAIREQVEQRRS